MHFSSKASAVSGLRPRIPPGLQCGQLGGHPGPDQAAQSPDRGDDLQGCDALNNKYADMFTAGIVDPAKVTRSALQNAASIAAMVLTTQAVITEIPEKNGNGMRGGMSPDMM